MPENPFRREGNRPLKSGSRGGTFDDMEPRVRALEDKFLVIEIKLDRLADDMKDLIGIVKKLNDDVMEIKGRLSEIPNTWQMVGICGTMLTLVLTGVGIAFTVAKFLQA